MNPLPDDRTKLEVRNLSVTLGSRNNPIQAVRGVSWSVSAGECLGIIGESGSGKSVSALAALDLLPPGAKREGEVLLDGEHFDKFSPDERRLKRAKAAMIFQEPSRSFDPITNFEATFRETLRAHNPRLTAVEAHHKASALWQEVHLSQPETRLKSYPHQLSGGMLQRVMIALALANDPEVLICDEPTTALDVTVQRQILKLLADLKLSRSLALVFISHDLAVVSQLADRLLVMYGGLVLESGPVQEVLSSPASPYTRALWSARIPLGSHWTKDPLHVIPGMPPDPRSPLKGCPFAPRCPRADSACASLPPLVGSGRQVRCHHPEIADTQTPAGRSHHE